MKVKKQIMVTIIILLILLIPTITKANIEVKPKSTSYTNISVSDAYDECYNLRNPYSSLGNNNLDPHLVLNKDWGAVAYLAISAYGKVKDATGPKVTVDGTEYTTTTGNETGVMDFGKAECTYTSSSIASGLEGSVDIRQSLINNKNSRYVETLPDKGTQNATNTKGMAIVETSGWFTSQSDYEPNKNYPLVVRTNILGFKGYDASGHGNGSFAGQPRAGRTFRPAIWNISN